MPDGESVLKLTSKAEISALLQWEDAANRANRATTALIQSLTLLQKVGGSVTGPGSGAGQGGAATGAPPPPPAAANPTPGTPGTPGTAPAPGWPGGQMPPWAQPPGSPPPPPNQPPAAPPAPPAPGGSGGGGQGGAATGSAPPSPSYASAYRRSVPLGNEGGGGFGSYMMGHAASFLSNTASTAIGVGLGSSLFGLPMAAIQRYMSLSTVLTQVDRKFRDAAEGSAMFGTSMGYGIARSAQLAEVLGKQRNTFGRDEGVAIAGLARFTGADPSAVLSSVGHSSELRGTKTTDADLAFLLRSAKDRGMDQGRFEEFLSRFESAVNQQFAQTGKVSTGGMMATQALPGLVYGAGDPRRANDQSLVEGLNQTMTGGGAMRSYMMRAMGYGSKDGPGYIDMRKRLDAGVYDPQNVVDLFGSFQQRGMGMGAQFRAIESVAGGSLKANQIEALVKALGTPEGLAKYKAAASGSPNDALAGFGATLSKDEFDAFSKAGFGGLGKRSISAGEAYENRIESTMMTVGSQLAKSIPDLQTTVDNVGRLLKDLVGDDIGGKIQHLSHGIEELTRQLEAASRGPLADAHEGFNTWSKQGTWGQLGGATWEAAGGQLNKDGSPKMFWDMPEFQAWWSDYSAVMQKVNEGGRNVPYTNKAGGGGQ